MHLLEIAALAVLVVFMLVLLAMLVMLVWIVFFDIECKGDDSRLIRWPAAIKSFWTEFWDFIDIITNGHRARKMMRQIWASENG